jgi:flavin-dependent dehydrogenase
VVVPERDVYAVDMRALIARLQAEAAAAGAELRGGVAVRGWLGDGLLDTTRGPVQADAVVDATGLGGSDLAWSPPVPTASLVRAAQEVRRVADPDGAARWAAETGVSLGEVACFTGVAGGYSVVHLRWTGDEVELLTGSLPPAPSAQQLLREQLARQPWIGERIFGGARAIPLRPPHLRLAEGRLARLGDSACQVYGAHGSGVGAQLVAAQVLAQAFAEGRGPAGYAADWQRRWGGRHAASAIFAHHARSLSPDDLGRLITSGLLGPWSVRPTLEQRPLGRPPLRVLPRLARGLATEAPTLRPMAPLLAKMALAPWIWSRHQPNRLWEAVARRLLPP